MAVPVLWPESYRKMSEGELKGRKHQHGAVNLKDLERFWMKEWSLISCQVFSNLIRHYRRKLRAVYPGKGRRNNWVPIIVANMKLEKAFISQWDFPPHFQLHYFMIGLEFCEFFEWKIKRINNPDLFSQPPLFIFTKGANISGGHCMWFQQADAFTRVQFRLECVSVVWTIGFKSVSKAFRIWRTGLFTIG